MHNDLLQLSRKINAQMMSVVEKNAIIFRNVQPLSYAGVGTLPGNNSKLFKSSTLTAVQVLICID